jgi:hypothetical protein
MMRRSNPRSVVLFLFSLSLVVACSLWSVAQCTLPSVPNPATIDSTFDGYVTQNGPGWTGGDGTRSVLLPDGTNLWMWSDSYIGTVNPTTRMRKNYLFTAHNSLTILNQTTGSWTTVGYPPQTTSYFVPSNKKDWFWVGNSIVVQTSPGVYEVKTFLSQWNSALQQQGESLATLSWPSLSILSTQSIALPDQTITWGEKMLQIGNTWYIYGTKQSGFSKTPYVARTTSINYFTQPSHWQYWNATQNKWMAGQQNATAMRGVPGITPEYSVDQIQWSGGTFYLMTGMDNLNPPYPLWNRVITYYSCSPQGPWTDYTIVYTTPEAGANGCKVGTLVAYNAKAHTELTDSTGILVSYNVNANDSSDLVCANDYMPRFVRMTIPGVTDNLDVGARH